MVLLCNLDFSKCFADYSGLHWVTLGYTGYTGLHTGLHWVTRFSTRIIVIVTSRFLKKIFFNIIVLIKNQQNNQR